MSLSHDLLAGCSFMISMYSSFCQPDTPVLLLSSRLLISRILSVRYFIVGAMLFSSIIYSSRPSWFCFIIFSNFQAFLIFVLHFLIKTTTSSLFLTNFNKMSFSYNNKNQNNIQRWTQIVEADKYLFYKPCSVIQ